ncbi:hypothetical protein Fuma_04259 [Fuerstiella marisgermanici]|uniref:Uncharacterized protein n=1 Tax=Fuerstiella marisgermanici TaxID=1891926 RepID=A0A1P8WKN7_9PLAN|nr:hypothetical protein Fuma_04259 [Fuerstiella marisgermanici]
MPKKPRKGHSSSGGIPRRRKALKHEVFQTVWREILRILTFQNTVTADDVHRYLEIPPEGMCQIAHAFRGLQAAGEIILVEIVRTDRPGQNGNRIGVWKRAESARVANPRPPIKRLFKAND